jgi:hypothetical protein
MKYIAVLFCLAWLMSACSNEDIVVEQGIFEIRNIENSDTYIGDTITIWGNNLGNGTNSSVNFDSTFALTSDRCIFWSSNKIMFEVPTQAFSTDIYIDKDGEQSNLLPINISAIPDLPLVVVSGNTYPMGSVTGNEDERPIHHVNIKKTLEVAKYEITQRFYELITGENPSQMLASDYPVHNVSWLDAVIFCNLLSEKMDYSPAYLIEGEVVTVIDTANGWRLPTEAEWEFLCRAGKSNDFSGIGRLEDMGWYSANSGMQLQPVGKKAANDFGIFDMHGNVSEWCFDLYAPDYYSSSPNEDPQGATEGSERVVRGGNYQAGNTECRSAFRTKNLDKMLCGIRIVRDVK